MTRLVTSAAGFFARVRGRSYFELSGSELVELGRLTDGAGYRLSDKERRETWHNSRSRYYEREM